MPDVRSLNRTNTEINHYTHIRTTYERNKSCDNGYSLCLVYSRPCDYNPDEIGTVTGLDDQATGPGEEESTHVLSKVIIDEENVTKSRGGELMTPAGGAI